MTSFQSIKHTTRLLDLKKEQVQDQIMRLHGKHKNYKNRYTTTGMSHYGFTVESIIRGF